MGKCLCFLDRRAHQVQNGSPGPSSYGDLIREVVWMVRVSVSLALLAQKFKISLNRTQRDFASTSRVQGPPWLLPLRWGLY